MVEKQPGEVYFLCVLFIVVSNFIWTTRIALELKVVFCSVLFILVLVFAFVFIELEKLKVKN
jgi:hypothetical protein